MPILSKSEIRRPLVQCVREVRVPVPLEQLAAVRHFYTRLVGLRPWPPGSQIPGGWGVGDPQCGVYFQFRHEPAVDPVRRRLTLVVDSLDQLENRLYDAAWPFERARGLGVTDRCVLVTDPIGHRVELRQRQPL